MRRRAVVLGGGGPVGVAWQTGLIAGLAQAGIDYEVDVDGHLVVHAANGETIDYWPQTQTWIVRGLLSDEQQGLHPLIMFCMKARGR